MGEREDKRRSERHRVRFHLVYDDGGSFNAGTVCDVSEGGLFLETALPLPVGTTVTLTPLDTAGQSVSEVRARVVRVVAYDPEVNLDGPAGMGLELIDLSAEERKAVVTMIRELEEAAAKAEGEVDPFLGIKVRPRGLTPLPGSTRRR